MAWCYGDLGILMITYKYAQSTHNIKLEKRTLQKLLKTTTRKDLYEAVVYDVQFCHGSCGLAHMYNRLYCETKHELFRESALYGLKITHSMGWRNSIDATTGYRFKSANKELAWEIHDELPEGANGVAVVLLSFLNPEDMGWDEAFMLS